MLVDDLDYVKSAYTISAKKIAADIINGNLITLNMMDNTGL